MTDGVKTRRQLVERALAALGVTAAGQPPSAEDVELVDGHLPPVLAMLQARGVLDDILPDEIPDEIYLPLAILLGDAATVDFGILRGSPDDPSTWAGKAMKAESDIRVIIGGRPTYRPTTAEYF